VRHLGRGRDTGAKAWLQGVTRPARHRSLLCLSTYPEDDASIRQRFLAYVPLLAEAGWDIRFEPIISPRLYRIKNVPGRSAVAIKAVLLVGGLLRRLAVLLLSRRYDAIWVHREAFPFFNPWPERLLRLTARGRILFDFDDALYVPSPGGNDWRHRLRDPASFRASVRCADVVTAGSPTLVDWALQEGTDAHFLPTCVDTTRYPVRGDSAAPLTIGWVGSWSTAPYLHRVLRPLIETSETGLRVLLVGGTNVEPIAQAIPGAVWRPWRRDREIADLSEFDIGIMPVPDSEWERGKCAYKLIQYMALGIPYVASPVGMNVYVTEESGGGLLADGDDEWAAALRGLISDPGLRVRLGRAGRAYAECHFDTSVWGPRLLALLREASRSVP
jgi:glycosyltransferase involved in cell wall biosynthesis